MLENSNLLEGKTAKRVNELLKDYQDITTKLADLDESKKKVLKELLELAPLGVNETNTYTFKVSSVSGRESVSLSKLKEQNENLYESLIPYMSFGKDYLVVRSIKLKGDRV